MPKKNNEFWNAPMSRKDWLVLYGASFVIGTIVSLATVWPIIGDSITRDVENAIDYVKEKFNLASEDDSRKQPDCEPRSEVEGYY